MKAATGNPVRLQEVDRLPQSTLQAWTRDHLNAPLLTLMRLGGYDELRVERAAGPYLHLAGGRRLLDLVSAYGALSHGHNHPQVLAAARWFDERGAADLLKEVVSPWAAALAHNLCSVAPEGLSKVFFCNSGTEAVEGALKLALRSFAGKRDRIVYAENSLHGKTFGSLAVTGRELYRAFVPRREDWPCVPFGDLDALRATFQADRERRIAGLILEPVQGEAGIIVPPEGYLAEAADLCRRHGALLILDEVQTGLGRTGTLFRCQAEAVAPDILCLAKALGGGVATIGATLVRPEIEKRAYGRINQSLVHTSTFGGRGRAAAVALAALEVALDEDFAGRAATLGGRLKHDLEKVRERHPDRIREVRGAGLMIGVELLPFRLRGLSTPLGPAGLNRIVSTRLAGIVGSELLHSHDILASFVLHNPLVLRIYPPLVATWEDLAEIAPALDAIFERGLGRVIAERITHAIRHAGLKTLRSWLARW